MHFFIKTLFVVAIVITNSLSQAQGALNDAFIQKQVDAFEQAYSQRELAFFEEAFSETATFTIHSKQRDEKHVIQYKKENVLQGELFQHPNPLAHLQRQEETIEYYNDNTQALLSYKMKPKPGNDYGGERGFQVDTQMLFQLVKGVPKIVSIITYIDFEPSYQAQTVP